MDIQILRFACYRHAVSGRLLIDGDPVCNTLENEDFLLPEGTYPVTMQTNKAWADHKFPMVDGKVPMLAGAGVYGRFAHIIAIGKGDRLGYLTKGSECFQLLNWRLKKQIDSFHHSVSLTITKSDDFKRII